MFPTDIPAGPGGSLRTLAVGVALTLASALLVAGPRQGPAVEPASKAIQPKLEAVPPTPVELTRADVEAFLDGLMPLEIEREDIAGAVVVVVKDGQVLFAKGYGYSTFEKKTHVSPEETLFRPGSISKLFTWTAVMQLVEQGKLELDRDVNEYLDFKIPATYAQPVTLRHLLTHTPGFEERVRHLFVHDADAMQPLSVYMATHVPRRIFPPGTVPAYSNYGTALAGYIVQRVSGRPFEEYVEEFIFKAVGMTRSTFRQPLPEALKPLMSNGYFRASQGPRSFELIPAAPAGSLSTSGSDIARFMIAHLQDGQFGGTRILQAETARLMHARQFGLHPAMNAMALGFYEESRNGHRIIGHGGDTMYFHSDLHLMLDAGVGFFVSYNSAGRGQISGRAALWRKFLDRYFPYTPPAPQPIADAAAHVREVSGTYLGSRRSDRSVVRALFLLGEATVSPGRDTTIEVSFLKEYSGRPKRLREVEPLLFRDVNGQDRVAFRRDASNRLFMVVDYPFLAFQAVPWYLDQRFILGVAVFTAVVFLLTLLLWPVAALVRRRYKQRLALAAGERRQRIAIRLACAVNLAILVASVAILQYGLKHIDRFATLEPWLRLIQVTALIGLAGTLLALYNAYRSWTTPERWWWTKVHDTAIALACLGFAWLLFVGRVLDFSLSY